jgi:hypothetical protein
MNMRQNYHLSVLIKKSDLVGLKSPFDILYNVTLNTFSGRETVELTIRELYIKK